MGFLERRPFRQAAGPARREDRYEPRPGHGNGGSKHQPLPPAALHEETARPGPARPAPARPEPARLLRLIELLGRSVPAEETERICAAYGLTPRYGAGRTRWYLGRESGLEVAADAQGTITAIFLHFHGDDGFAPYAGEIPGAPGAAPHRDALHDALGRPDAGGDSYRERYLGDFGPWDRWDRPGYVLHAQYAMDAESLDRITLKAPGSATGREG